jgi:hypothetical protein
MEAVWSEYEVTNIIKGGGPRNTTYTVFFNQVGTKFGVVVLYDKRSATLKVGDRVLGYITPEREFVWKKKRETDGN